MRVTVLLPWLLVGASLVSAQPARTLDIYPVDVEGGAATLIVTPARESVLVDAGWPGNDGRDVRRIRAAMEAAGISRIDHMVTTHYHTDHVGGVPPLAAAVPIGAFYDHGEMQEPYAKDYETSYRAYTAAVKTRKTLAPGEALKLKPASDGRPVVLTLVAGHGTVHTVAGAPANPACAGVEPRADDLSDNARSVAFVLGYGSFDFFDAGDLTWNTEARLVCPANTLPVVDVYQVTHHGLDTSNHPLVLRALAPTVAVMNNGAKKGGSAATVRELKALPSLQALYQLHRNVVSGPEDNTSPELTANLDETPDAGHMVSVHVRRDGTYDVINHRTGQTRAFTSKP
jgi:competence protein ComEC